MVSAVWEILVIIWNRLDNPHEFQNWVFSKTKKAVKEVPSWAIEWWQRLRGSHEQDRVSLPQKAPLSNPVKGRESQTRALFSFVLVVASFFVALNLFDAFSLWAVPPGVAIFALLALLVMVNALRGSSCRRTYGIGGFLRWCWWSSGSRGQTRNPINCNSRTFLMTPLRRSWSAIRSPRRISRPRPRQRRRLTGWSMTPAHARPGLLAPGDSRRREAETCGRELFGWGGAIAGLDIVRTRPTRPGDQRFRSLCTADHVRLGRHGGGGYYVKVAVRPAPEHPHASAVPPQAAWLVRRQTKVPRDCESTVVRSIALREVWRMFNPEPVGGAPPEDRGRVLESCWVDLRQVPLQELRAPERLGLLPSLVLRQ